jgi:hypothetical protein
LIALVHIARPSRASLPRLAADSGRATAPGTRLGPPAPILLIAGSLAEQRRAGGRVLLIASTTTSTSSTRLLMLITRELHTLAVQWRTERDRHGSFVFDGCRYDLDQRGWLARRLVL